MRALDHIRVEVQVPKIAAVGQKFRSYGQHEVIGVGRGDKEEYVGKKKS